MANALIRSGHANQPRQGRGATGQSHGGLTVAESVDLMGGALRVSGGGSDSLTRVAARHAEAPGAPCPVLWLALEGLIARSFAPPFSAADVPILRYQ
jgi:hypothetical protein